MLAGKAALQTISEVEAVPNWPLQASRQLLYAFKEPQLRFCVLKPDG